MFTFRCARRKTLDHRSRTEISRWRWDQVYEGRCEGHTVAARCSCLCVMQQFMTNTRSFQLSHLTNHCSDFRICSTTTPKLKINSFLFSQIQKVGVFLTLVTSFFFKLNLAIYRLVLIERKIRDKWTAQRLQCQTQKRVVLLKHKGHSLLIQPHFTLQIPDGVQRWLHVQAPQRHLCSSHWRHLPWRVGGNVWDALWISVSSCGGAGHALQLTVLCCTESDQEKTAKDWISGWCVRNILLSSWKRFPHADENPQSAVWYIIRTETLEDTPCLNPGVWNKTSLTGMRVSGVDGRSRILLTITFLGPLVSTNAMFLVLIQIWRGFTDAEDNPEWQTWLWCHPDGLLLDNEYTDGLHEGMRLRLELTDAEPFEFILRFAQNKNFNWFTSVLEKCFQHSFKAFVQETACPLQWFKGVCCTPRHAIFAVSGRKASKWILKIQTKLLHFDPTSTRTPHCKIFPMVFLWDC